MRSGYESKIQSAKSELERITADKDSMGKAQIITQITREMNQKRSAVIGRNLSNIQKLQNGIARFLSKFDKDAGKRYIDDLEAINSKKASSAASERASKLKEEYDKVTERKKAESDYYNSHRREELKKERDKAYNQAAARNAAPTPNRK